jgi:hypothetical protein
MTAIPNIGTFIPHRSTLTRLGATSCAGLAQMLFDREPLLIGDVLGPRRRKHRRTANCWQIAPDFFGEQ